MKKILVVDNSATVRKFMTRVLRKAGHQVKTAEDGLSALDMLKTDVPDLIFIDLIMPNIPGDKLCRILRSMDRMKKTHLVILSAIAAEDSSRVGEILADAWVAKGPALKMTAHVLEVLDRLESKEARSLPTQILGLQDLRPRQITREMLSYRRHLEAILGSISEGIIELTQEHKIVYVNRFAISLIDLPEEKLLASDFLTLFADLQREKIGTALQQVRTRRKEVCFDAPLKLNDKEVLLELIPIQDRSSTSVIVIINDISEKTLLQAQLRQAQKMEAVGTLAGGIAHDFNNILQAISGYNQLLMIKDHPDGEVKDQLKMIEKAVQHGSELTRRLMVFSRKVQSRLQPIDLNEEVLHVSKILERTIPKMIHIELLLNDNLRIIDADAVQIEQVIINLGLNARDAMPEGGRLVFKTRNLDIDAQHPVMNLGALPGKYVELTVSDTGHGIEADNLTQIFEPFYTTKKKGAGTGLGLAVVYGIVKSHGGCIGCQSYVGRGTIFHIYLPASEAKAKRPPLVTEEGTAHYAGKETILIVDDNSTILALESETLEKQGYTTISAMSGEEALEIFQRQKDRIDLIILDINMPGIGGKKCLEKILKIDPHAKVIMTSGYATKDLARKMLQNGAKRFVGKPYRFEELLQKIREALDMSKC